MSTPNPTKRRNHAYDGDEAFAIPQLPADVQIVAPALLQLNRGTGPDHRPIYETCPTKCPLIPAMPLPDCTECQATATELCFNIHCETCFADCASHCASPCNEGDDCHIAQPCYEEHCAPGTCPETKCPVDPCVGATCTEALACDATCYSDGCFWPWNQNLAAFDPQLCLQGECHGFLPCNSGFQDFNQSHNIHDHFSQYAQDLGNAWHQPVQSHGHQYITYDHINPSNHHKRPKTENSEIDLDFQYPSTQAYQPWQNLVSQSYGSSHLNSQNNLALPQNIGSQNWHAGQIDFPLDTSANCYSGMPVHQQSYDTNLASNPSAIDGITCGLSHISVPVQELEDPAFKHSPFCGFVSKKRNRSKPEDYIEQPRKRPITPLLPTPSSSDSSPAELKPISPNIDTVKSEPEEKEADLSCRWLLNGTHEEQIDQTCDMVFNSSKELDAHIQKEHTNKLGPQQFICSWDGCKTVFKHRGKLNRHVSGAHSHYHAYQCLHCKRTFCTKEQLKNHETTHTGERRYKCQFCGHSSATKTQHNTHERTHTKEKPFACPHCPHRSGDSSNLSKHIKNKHAGLAASRQLPTAQAVT